MSARIPSASLLLASLILSPTEASAQPVCGWVQVQKPSSAPPHRRYQSMVFDSRRGVSVMFGGQGTVGYLSDVWEWNGTKWSQGLQGPSPRVTSAMAYDSARGVTVLFGGWTGAAPARDTWEYNGTTWSRRSTGGPAARSLHAMAFDAKRGQVVMFGGWTGAAALSDTWVWNGTAWTNKIVSGPSARYRVAMAYDSKRNVVVLHGGSSTGSDALTDTWEWDGAKWARVSTTGPARQRHALAFDASRGVVVLYGGGGASASTLFDDTWEWDGVSWKKVPVVGPPKRYYHALAYDSKRDVTVLFGGDSSGPLGDTWEYSMLRSQRLIGTSSPHCKGMPGISTNSCAEWTTRFSLTTTDAPHFAPGILIVSGASDPTGSVSILGARLYAHLTQPVPAILLGVSSDGFGRSTLSVKPPLPKGVKISLQYLWSNMPYCSTGNALSATPALEITF